MKIILYYFFPKDFSHQRYLVVFHRSLSDSKCPHVASTLLSILPDFKSVEIRIISIHFTQSFF